MTSLQGGQVGKLASEVAASGANTEGFYADLKPFDNFSELTHFERYLSLPDDGLIGIADIAQSTRAIETGRYTMKRHSLLGRHAAPPAAITIVYRLYGER
jgi:hypothetical protein